MMLPVRTGLIAALCVLGLAGCQDSADAPAAPTAGEASALADAKEMLAERVPSETAMPTQAAD